MNCKKVLVVSVHPDDETIGAGGTLLKHVSSGDELHWIIVTSMLPEHGYTAEAINLRNKEIDLVAGEFGILKTYKLDYPTAKLTEGDIPGLISAIGRIVMENEIEIIYSVNRSDAHSDHRITSQAVAACTKSFRYPSVKRYLMYECVSETEFSLVPQDNPFIANYYVDISEFFLKKIEISRIFKSEFGDHPFPRSERNLEALATLRGATAGVAYSEAFQIVKWIDK